MSRLLFKSLSYQIQGSFFEIYKTLSCSFKETVYHQALIVELEARGLNVSSEKSIGVIYHNKRVGTYIPDLIVNESILIEIKSKPLLTRNDSKQFWYYLKGSDYRVGYLVNFGHVNGVEFIRRVYDLARSQTFKSSRDFA